MEENNDIFLGGGDALVHLAGQIHKKYSTIFVWGHPFSTYVSYDRFFNPLPLCTHMCSFRVTPPFCAPDFIDLIRSSPILIMFVCAIVPLYCFTSEIQELMFLSQTLATFWHLIQVTEAYLGRRFVNGGFKLLVILLFMIADES